MQEKSLAEFESLFDEGSINLNLTGEIKGFTEFLRIALWVVLSCKFVESHFSSVFSLQFELIVDKSNMLQ